MAADPRGDKRGMPEFENDGREKARPRESGEVGRESMVDERLGFTPARERRSISRFTMEQLPWRKLNLFGL